MVLYNFYNIIITYITNYFLKKKIKQGFNFYQRSVSELS